MIYICFQNLHTNLEFNISTSTPTATKMESSRNVFWGLVIKPGKRYETEVQEPFRITKVLLSTYKYERLVVDD